MLHVSLQSMQSLRSVARTNAYILQSKHSIADCIPTAYLTMVPCPESSMPITLFFSKCMKCPEFSRIPPSLSIFTCQVLPQPPRSVCTSRALSPSTSAHPYPKSSPTSYISKQTPIPLTIRDAGGWYNGSYRLASQASSALRSWFGHRFESPMSRSYVSQVCRIRALGSMQVVLFLGFFWGGKALFVYLCMAICFSFMYA
jgi:hypothetical protein